MCVCPSPSFPGRYGGTGAAGWQKMEGLSFSEEVVLVIVLTTVAGRKDKVYSQHRGPY